MLETLRFLGSALMTLAALGSVLFLHKLEYRREAELLGLMKLLSFIRSGMLLHRIPLEEIYMRFEEETLAACGFLTVLRREGLCHALTADLLSLSTEELSFLIRYADGLGERFLSEEEEASAQTRETLQALIEQHRGEKKRSFKMKRTLILTGSGMLLLLLL